MSIMAGAAHTTSVHQAHQYCARLYQTCVKKSYARREAAFVYKNRESSAEAAEHSFFVNQRSTSSSCGDHEKKALPLWAGLWESLKPLFPVGAVGYEVCLVGCERKRGVVAAILQLGVRVFSDSCS